MYILLSTIAENGCLNIIKYLFSFLINKEIINNIILFKNENNENILMYASKYNQTHIT